MEKVKVMVLVLLTLGTLFAFRSYQISAISESQTVNKLESTSIFDLKNSKIALQKGISGYISIKFDKESYKEITLNKGTSRVIDINLLYTSYDENKESTIIEIDPSSGLGLSIEKQLGKSGETISLNNLITYEPSGKVTLISGEIKTIRMTVLIPQNISDFKIPLGPVGITAEVPIINYGEGILNVK